MNNEDEYESIDELIKILESIKEKGSGNINFPKALYLMAKKINRIDKAMKFLCISGRETKGQKIQEITPVKLPYDIEKSLYKEYQEFVKSRCGVNEELLGKEEYKTTQPLKEWNSRCICSTQYKCKENEEKDEVHQ